MAGWSANTRGCARALNPGLWLFDPLRGLKFGQRSALALDVEIGGWGQILAIVATVARPQGFVLAAAILH